MPEVLALIVVALGTSGLLLPIDFTARLLIAGVCGVLTIAALGLLRHRVRRR